MDKIIDRKLHIDTIGFREWNSKEARNYNRTESTPYEVLDILFNEILINNNDRLVDFGCGKGRVALYFNYIYNIFVTGIELNELSYEELIENKLSYLKTHKRNKEYLNFLKITAQKYEINEKDNIFYFFNPFSIKIFKMVIENIYKSLEIKKREINIILYYPSLAYLNFLDNKTVFNKTKSIKIPGKSDADKRLIIYSNY